MNLAEIETFLMIVKTKNITKTAENLFLSQPTVSHRLKSLEEELDVKLIARKKGYKQIEITTQGEAFIPIDQSNELAAFISKFLVCSYNNLNDLYHFYRDGSCFSATFDIMHDDFINQINMRLNRDFLNPLNTDQYREFNPGPSSTKVKDICEMQAFLFRGGFYVNLRKYIGKMLADSLFAVVLSGFFVISDEYRKKHLYAFDRSLIISLNNQDQFILNDNIFIHSPTS